MNFRKIQNMISNQMSQQNHIMISVEFKRKILVNFYIFKNEDQYEIPSYMKEAFSKDPILKNKGVGEQNECKETFDNVICLKDYIKAS